MNAKRPRGPWRELTVDRSHIASRKDAKYVVEMRVYERAGVRVISELATIGPFGETPTWHVSVSQQTARGPCPPSRNTKRIVRRDFDMEAAQERLFDDDSIGVGLVARHFYLAVDVSKRPS